MTDNYGNGLPVDESELPPYVSDAGDTGVLTMTPGAFDLLNAQPDLPAPMTGSPLAGSPGASTAAPDVIWRQMLGIEGGVNQDGSFRTSPAGAIGPAQLMPGTAPTAMRLAGFDPSDQSWRTNAAVNVAAGRAYYDNLVQQFGDPIKAGAAYNAGPGAVRRAIARADSAGSPGAWTSYLPAETRNYVARLWSPYAAPAPAQFQPASDVVPLQRWGSDANSTPVAQRWGDESNSTPVHASPPQQQQGGGFWSHVESAVENASQTAARYGEAALSGIESGAASAAKGASELIGENVPALRPALRTVLGPLGTFATEAAGVGLGKGAEAFQKGAKQAMPANPTAGEQLAEQAGGFVVPVGASMVDPIAGAAVFASQGYQSAHDEALAKGATPEEAHAAGVENALAQGALGAVPLPAGTVAGLITRGMEGAAGAAARLGASALAGGELMGASQLAANVVAHENYDPNRPFFEGVPEAALTGALASGAIHVGAAGARYAGQRAGEAIIPRAWDHLPEATRQWLIDRSTINGVPTDEAIRTGLFRAPQPGPAAPGAPAQIESEDQIPVTDAIQRYREDGRAVASDGLQERAEADGVPVPLDVPHDDLLANVVEHEASTGEQSDAHADAIETDASRLLSPNDILALNAGAAGEAGTKPSAGARAGEIPGNGGLRSKPQEAAGERAAHPAGGGGDEGAGPAPSAYELAQQFTASHGEGLTVPQYVDNYIAGDYRSGPVPLAVEQFAANHAAEIEREFQNRTTEPIGPEPEAQEPEEAAPVSELETRGAGLPADLAALARPYPEPGGETPHSGFYRFETPQGPITWDPATGNANGAIPQRTGVTADDVRAALGMPREQAGGDLEQAARLTEEWRAKLPADIARDVHADETGAGGTFLMSRDGGKRIISFFPDTGELRVDGRARKGAKTLADFAEVVRRDRPVTMAEGVVSPEQTWALAAQRREKPKPIYAVVDREGVVHDWSVAKRAAERARQNNWEPEAFAVRKIGPDDLQRFAEAPAETSISEPEAKGAAETAQMLQDAGEKIGGARKDQWAERGLRLSDLKEMNEGEAFQYVTKDHVWPKPDYAKMVENGVSPDVAAAIKIIRDRLSARPREDSAQGREDYITMLGHVREVLEAARSLDDIKAANTTLMYERTGLDRNSHYGARLEDQQAARRLLFSVAKGRRISFALDNSDIQKIRKMVSEGWPSKQPEPWERRFEVRQWGAERFVVRSKGEKRTLPGEYPTREAAADAARQAYDALQGSKGEKTPPSRPHLDKIQRIGMDIRGGRDVTSEDFIRDLGFRGVEFGNWVAGDERQRSINMAYDALHDLAGILGVPPKAMSLDGQLGIAFGARGKGSALAHYEPGKLVINLTKLSGAGALAHEWGHALDHYFGTLDEGETTRGAPKGASGWYDRPRNFLSGLKNLRPELAQRFDDVMRAIFERDQTKAEQVRDTELAIERLKAAIGRQKEQVEAAKSRPEDRYAAKFIKDSADWIKANEETLVRLGKRLADQTDSQEPTVARKVDTSYFKEAKALSGKSADKGYWARPTEMFARAFESYVFDKTRADEGQSDYLVHGVEPERYAKGYKGNPYPASEDRARIDAAFDALFSEMRHEDTGNGVRLYSRPEQAATEAHRTYADLASRLADVGIAPHVALNLVESLNGPAGSYHNRLITIAMDAPDTMEALNHEVVHAVRDAFTDREWNALARVALRNDALMRSIRRRYPELDRDAQTEEAVADMFKKWAAGKGEPKGPLRSAFERARDIFRALGNGLRGRGFLTAESVMRAIDRGEIGGRMTQGRYTPNPLLASAWHGSPHDYVLFNDKDVEINAKYSRPEDNADRTFPAEWLNEMADNDEMFRYPIAKGATVRDVFKEIAPSIRYEGAEDLHDNEHGAERRYLLRTPAKHDIWVYERGDEIWLDVSHLREGELGSRVYQAVADLAYNTGRKFIGDPAGLSDVALRRRTDNMLSSALKHGTTDHLEPHPYQRQGNPALGVPPLHWREGDTLGNIQSMIDTSLASITHDVPQMRDAYFDFRDGTYRTGDGQPLSDGTLERWVDEARRGGAPGAGRATLKRGILLRSLSRAESGQRPGLLEQVYSQWGQRLLGSGLKGVLYSRPERAEDEEPPIAAGAPHATEPAPQPTSKPGPLARLLGSALEGGIAKVTAKADSIIPDNVLDLFHDARQGVTPMAEGSPRAKAAAKDFANTLRLAAHQWGRVDEWLAKNFDPEARRRMWEAADEHGVLQRRGLTPGPGQGLNRLNPRERSVVEQLQARADQSFDAARELGMVQGEGLESYVPRMIVEMTASGPKVKGKASPREARRGGNLSTTTGQLRQRKYETVEETEAAAKASFGENVEVVRDIRTLALATQRLDKAIAGRTLIEKIKAMSKNAGGGELVTEDGASDPSLYFTIPGHPALQVWRPKFVKDPETGKITAAEDQNGDTVFEAKPLWISREFEGPMKAVLSEPSGGLARALMDLKAKMMSVIMYSPLMHNAVIWGKAIPADPVGILTLRTYVEGNRLRKDPNLMREAILAGMDPIGHRYFNQDIAGIAAAEGMDLAPGRSWTAQVLGSIPGLFDREAGDAVRRAVDKFGDVWHNTFLWDRIADLQAGIYAHVRDDLAKKGVDPQTAQRLAAHFANRYAGALPMESMSKGARSLANIALFSRSFTLGNLAAFKDMAAGLPSDVRAQIERDAGSSALMNAQGLARRKAISMLALDVGLQYVGLSLAAGAVAWLAGQEYQWPWENEPDKKNRFLIGYQKDGTAIYGRLPTGKVAEDQWDWVTQPRQTLLNKLSPYGRLAYQVAANDKGFGQKLYDPYDDTPTGTAKNIGRVVWAFMGGMMPLSQFQAASDLATGQADDRRTATMQALSPLFGLTVSKGAPGGPAMADMYRVKDEHDFRVNEARPEINAMIRHGDFAGARATMTELGMAPSLQAYTIRVALNPRLRMSKRQLQDFMYAATPAEKEQFLEHRQEDMERLAEQ